MTRLRIQRLLNIAGFSALVIAASAAHAKDAPPLCTTPDRACLERTVNSYFRGLLRTDASTVPFADNVRATEQETVAVTSRVGFLSEFKASGAISGLRDIRLYTDVKTGDVTAFLMVDVRSVNGAKPFSVRRAQRFRVSNGLITQVEIINFNGKSTVSLWPAAAK